MTAQSVARGLVAAKCGWFRGVVRREREVNARYRGLQIGSDVNILLVANSKRFQVRRPAYGSVPS